MSLSTCTFGVYHEKSDDPHVAARLSLLSRSHEPPNVETISTAAHPALVSRALEQMAAHGIALVEFDQPLENEDFIAFGKAFGNPIPEHDPATQQFTENEVVLNVLSKNGHNTDVASQPFSTRFLTLHSESSRAPEQYQPRYIVLMCVEPGSDVTSAQTLIVPMKSVADRLSESSAKYLQHMRYRGSSAVPTLLRQSEIGPIFSFRDFESDSLEWESQDGLDPESGNRAIGELMQALYHPDDCFGLTWRRGLIVVIDNIRVFHGRTMANHHSEIIPRHLKRLRLR